LKPPVAAGGVNMTVAWAFPGVALTPVGAPGSAAGVTGLEAAEGRLFPAAFVAVTLKVYWVPLVSPVTV
jgi:hypothetical protein